MEQEEQGKRKRRRTARLRGARGTPRASLDRPVEKSAALNESSADGVRGGVRWRKRKILLFTEFEALCPFE